MKKTFTFFTALLLSLSLFAFPYSSILTISNTSGKPVKLIIDNKDCNDNNSGDIVISDIKSGYHNIKVFRESYQWGSKKRRMIYSGNIYLKSGFHMDITINRFGKAFLDESPITQGAYEETGTGNDCGNDYNQPMTATEFSQFKETICNGSFESTKLSLAKQGISNNYLTADQVKKMLELFSFESSKLDIAKTAYRATTDKGNYFIVSDALGYSSSKEELARFLQTSR